MLLHCSLLRLFLKSMTCVSTFRISIIKFRAFILTVARTCIWLRYHLIYLFIFSCKLFAHIVLVITISYYQLGENKLNNIILVFEGVFLKHHSLVMWCLFITLMVCFFLYYKTHCPTSWNKVIKF
jgi:hypothetical protein